MFIQTDRCTQKTGKCHCIAKLRYSHLSKIDVGVIIKIVQGVQVLQIGYNGRIFAT